MHFSHLEYKNALFCCFLSNLHRVALRHNVLSPCPSETVLRHINYRFLSLYGSFHTRNKNVLDFFPSPGLKFLIRAVRRAWFRYRHAELISYDYIV